MSNIVNVVEQKKIEQLTRIADALEKLLTMIEPLSKPFNQDFMGMIKSFLGENKEEDT